MTTPAPARQAQRTGFTAVAREQLPWLYPLARRLVGGDRAEDTVQECLLKAYRRFDSLRDRQAAPAWFRQILLNCARDRRRRDAARPAEEPLDPRPGCRLHRTTVEEDPRPARDGVCLELVHSFSTDDVWAILDRIPGRYRAPLVLVHMEGHPTKQVAKMLGVPQGTVLSWLHRGRQHYRRELHRYAAERGLLVDG